MKILSFDTETTINSEIHGGMAKAPENNIATVIWTDNPNHTNIAHNYKNRYRTLPNAVIDEILASDVVVGVNFGFDLSYILHYWFKKDNIFAVWDCSLVHYLLSGQRWTYPSLAEMQEYYLGQTTKIDRISKLYERGIGADKIIQSKSRCPRLFRLYESYCDQDGKTPLLIFKKQLELVNKHNMLKLVQAYNAYMVCLTWISSNGLYIDRKLTEETIRDFKLKELENLELASKLVAKYWNDPRLPEFNIKSNDHKSAILYGGVIKSKEKIKIPTGEFYKNGNPKFTSEYEEITIKGFGLSKDLTQESKKEGIYKTDTPTLDKIYKLSSNEDVKLYISYQRQASNYAKMVSTYLDKFLKNSINGYIHTKFNNTAVATGRLSSADPNMQNCPSKGQMGVAVQKCLSAPSDEWVCINIDWSQLEMFIAAWNSCDDALIEDLNNGLDFHCQSLSFAHNMPYDEVYRLCKVDKDPKWEALRSQAKAVTFQDAYGAGDQKIALSTGLSGTVVREIRDKMYQKYWKLKLYKEHVFDTVSKQLKVSTKYQVPFRERKISKNGRRFTISGEEILPLYSGKDIIGWTKEVRNVGYYRMPHGKLYAFQEYGVLDKQGNLKKSISPTQTKNYTIQGGAGDVVACATVEVCKYILQNQEDIIFVNQVHDSFWMYMKNNSKKDLHLSRICDIMTDIPRLLKQYLNVDINFKFQVEVKQGPNFGEMAVYKLNEDRQ